MKLFGEPGPVDTFVETTKKRFDALAETHGGKTPHSLSAAERLTGNKLLALVGIE